MIAEVPVAAVKLGLPVLLMSWWSFSWLYRRGLLDINANHKETDKAVDAFRKEKKNAKNQDADNDFWTERWMRFGGGFYGLTALWTFIAIEIQQGWDFLFNIQAFIDSYNGPIQLLVNFAINQGQNFGQAFAWVIYWRPGFSFVFMGVAYLAYLGGMQLAKQLDMKDLIKQMVQIRH